MCINKCFHLSFTPTFSAGGHRHSKFITDNPCPLCNQRAHPCIVVGVLHRGTGRLYQKYPKKLPKILNFFSNVLDCSGVFLIVLKYYERSHLNVTSLLDILLEEPPPENYFIGAEKSRSGWACQKNLNLEPKNLKPVPKNLKTIPKKSRKHPTFRALPVHSAAVLRSPTPSSRQKELNILDLIIKF